MRIALVFALAGATLVGCTKDYSGDISDLNKKVSEQQAAVTALQSAVSNAQTAADAAAATANTALSTAKAAATADELNAVKAELAKAATADALAAVDAKYAAYIPAIEAAAKAVEELKKDGVTVDKDGKIDFNDKSVTENTRVSYPIDHIKNIVRPISTAPAAESVIFLSADAFGVLPPVSVLTPEQTQYYFLSGFTAKLAGTERGITEPTPTFSACFGQAFLELPPTKYAEELVKRMQASGAKAYLVNTGWNGTGKRISIKDTRGIIDAILNGDINNAPTKKIPYFDFEVPTQLNGVDTNILDPRDTYANKADWEEKAKDLAGRFIKNFDKYTFNEAGKALVAAGPKV